MNNPIISYSKANKERKKVILKKFGVNSLERLKEVLHPKTTEQKVSKAELSRILTNNHGVTLKVSFQKQVKEKDAVKEIMSFYYNSTPKTFESDLSVVVKKVLNGETRVAEGFHNNKVDAMNRLYFVESTVELNKESNSDNRIILLSLNNLNWIEINQTKYILK